MGGIASGDLIGIIKEIDPSYEGDNEDVSGLSDVENGIIRVKNLPIDVDGSISFSGIVDRAQTGYDSFHTAMKQRTADTTIGVERPDGTGVDYTGHADSYNPETVTRDEATVKFSVDFTVNSETEYTPA